MVPLTGQHACHRPDDYEAFIAGWRRLSTSPAIDENDAAAMCYTSGTTGPAEGRRLQPPLDRAAHAGDRDGRLLGLSNRDWSVRSCRCSMSMRGVCRTRALMAGAKLVMPGPHLDAVSLLDLYESEAVTFSAGVPTIWFAHACRRSSASLRAGGSTPACA